MANKESNTVARDVERGILNAAWRVFFIGIVVVAVVVIVRLLLQRFGI